METVDVYVGDQSGSQGNVTVTGPGSHWTTGNLVVGAGGSGALSLADCGWVSTMGNGVIGSGFTGPDLRLAAPMWGENRAVF